MPKKTDAGARTCVVAKEVHFELLENQNASISTNSPAGIGRVVIRHHDGKVEIHVLGKTEFNFSPVDDFPEPDSPDALVFNVQAHQLAFDVFLGDFLSKFKALAVSEKMADKIFASAVKKEALNLWSEFQVKCEQRLHPLFKGVPRIRS